MVVSQLLAKTEPSFCTSEVSVLRCIRDWRVETRCGDGERGAGAIRANLGWPVVADERGLTRKTQRFVCARLPMNSFLTCATQVDGNLPRFSAWILKWPHFHLVGYLGLDVVELVQHVQIKIRTSPVQPERRGHTTRSRVPSKQVMPDVCPTKAENGMVEVYCHSRPDKTNERVSAGTTRGYCGTHNRVRNTRLGRM